MKKKINYLIIIKKYEGLLISVVVIFAVLILSLFLLLPNFENANSIFREQSVLAGRLEKLKTKDNLLASIDYQTLKNNFPKIGQVLPENKEYVSLFSTFDNLEKNFGITITRTDFQFGVVSTDSGKLQKAPGTSAYVVPITIEVTGNFSSVEKFIKALGDFSGRFITLDSVSWEINKENNYIISLSGKAYYYPLSTTLGSVDSPLPKTSDIEEKILNEISKITIIAEDNLAGGKINVGKKDLFQ